jgi:hypothetical protein
LKNLVNFGTIILRLLSHLLQIQIDYILYRVIQTIWYILNRVTDNLILSKIFYYFWNISKSKSPNYILKNDLFSVLIGFIFLLFWRKTVQKQMNKVKLLRKIFKKTALYRYFKIEVIAMPIYLQIMKVHTIPSKIVYYFLVVYPMFKKILHNV